LNFKFRLISELNCTKNETSDVSGDGSGWQWRSQRVAAKSAKSESLLRGVWPQFSALALVWYWRRKWGQSLALFQLSVIQYGGGETVP